MKFATAKRGSLVYSSTRGRGMVWGVADGQLIVKHDRGIISAYDMDGKCPHGEIGADLLWWSKDDTQNMAK